MSQSPPHRPGGRVLPRCGSRPWHVAAFVLLVGAFALAAPRPVPGQGTLPPDLADRLQATARAASPTDLSAFVIEAIAERPSLAAEIVTAAAAAAPAYAATIAAAAARAYPAFAPAIAAAAARATPETAPSIAAMTIKALAGAPGAASPNAIQKAVRRAPGVAPFERQWKVAVGSGVSWAPEYEGADAYDFDVLPFFDIEFRRFVFLGFERGLGINLFRRGNFLVAPRITYDPGRDEDESSRLVGTGDVDESLEAGLLTSLVVGPWRATLDVRQGITDGHQGFFIIANGSYIARLSPRATLLLEGDAFYAGDDYMNAFFGVTPAQRGPGRVRPVFDPESGVKHVGSTLILEYVATEHVFGRLIVRGRRLLGDAAQSPLTDPDSKNQFFLGTLVAYRL